MPMTGDSVLPEAQLTQAMMDRIARVRPASTAEALRELRAAFPQIPLAARVTALEAMLRADPARRDKRDTIALPNFPLAPRSG